MLRKKYPDLKCTTKNENGLPAEFPTLFLHELTPVESGQDLENVGVNAVLATIEIQVWTNTTEMDCRQIIADATTEMKALQFNIIAMPVIEMKDKIAWGVIRCRRMIGANDNIMN